MNGDHTRLEIFDLRGRTVNVLINDTMAAGRHEIAWDGRTDNGAQVAGGIYLVRLKHGDTIDIRKISLLK